jgi:hypothetical protein
MPNEIVSTKIFYAVLKKIKLMNRNAKDKKMPTSIIRINRNLYHTKG